MSRQMATVTMEKPGGLLNLNDRGNHFALHRGHEVWRDAAFWSAKQHRLSCRGAVGQVEVMFYIGTKRPNHRRDPHNFAPTVKAICDGFTRAAVWADDDSKHVHTYEPVFTNEIPANQMKIVLTWEDRL